MDKLKNHIKKLFSQKISSENAEDENVSLFLEFIEIIYNDRSFAIFPFPFLEKVDEFILEQNDMIEKLFSKIQSEYPKGIDIISSGSFGDKIYKLIENGDIDFEGNVIIVNGSIRKVKEDLFNEIQVVKKRYKDISKKFVFVDDSFVFGGTRDRIKDYLKKYNSKAIKTFVIYTHNVENSNDVYSLYCYSENYNEEVIPINNSIKLIENIDLKKYEDEIWEKIDNGDISKLKDLMLYIKSLESKNESTLLKYSKYIRS